MSWNFQLDKKYGVHGTQVRTEFELKAQTFIVGELLKLKNQKTKLTQAEMVEKLAIRKIA